jgi:5-methylthioadenosine/S-adenosylhomocysteine deaminase
MKLASGFAPVKRMLELGVNVGIGTDGPASNNDLDMFEEVRLAAFIAKGYSGDPTALPARTALAMATRLGANAMHIGHLTGSLEAGKRADLILVDVTPLHNAPRFRRDPNNGVYAQIVYASKATDVTDVMINGEWVMRGKKLMTLDEEDLLYASQDYARKIDIFLMQREKYILSKLIAIGGAEEEESFEVQGKASISDPQAAIDTLNGPEFTILRQRHYKEYDTYFAFEDSDEGYLRFREDHFIGDNGEVTNVRSRLTLIGPTREREFPQGVLLSRSRYLAPATQSLRFYREYFKPTGQVEIEKERRRFLVHYKNIEFFINVDHVTKPEMGYFIEVKSRTWSRRDAENKSRIVAELLELLGGSPDGVLPDDYIKMVEVKQ